MVLHQAVAAPPLRIAFLSEGFLEADKSQFLEVATSMSERLVAADPFCRFRGHIQCDAYFIASRDSGCDATYYEDEKDTAFEATFRSRESAALYPATGEPLAEFMADRSADLVVVLVNTDRYGGSTTLISLRGGWLPCALVASGRADRWELMLRGIGHGLGGLATEYGEPHDGPPRALPAVDPAAPNAAATDEQAQEKWAHAMSRAEGKRVAWVFRDEDVLRPWATCVMFGGETDVFCPICNEVVYRKLSEHCGLEFKDDWYHIEYPLSRWQATR